MLPSWPGEIPTRTRDTSHWRWDSSDHRRGRGPGPYFCVPQRVFDPPPLLEGEVTLLSDLPNSQEVTPDSWSRIVGTADLPATTGNLQGGSSFCRVHHWDGMGPGWQNQRQNELMFNLHTGQPLVLWGVSSARLGKNLATYTEL